MPQNPTAFWGGIFFSLAAGMMWGLVFVGPLMLPEYPAALHTFGRYLAFGVIALPLAFIDRAELRRLNRADWLASMNYTMAEAIERAGPVWISLLPRVIRALETDA